MWTFYLAGAAMAFENGGLCNFQIQFSRSRTELPIVRDYMVEGERALGGGRFAAFRFVIPAQAGIQTRYRCASCRDVRGYGFPPSRE